MLSDAIVIRSRSISRSAFTKKSLQVTNLFVRSKWHPRLDIALILANSVLACIVWNDMPNSYRQPLLIANVLLVLVMLVLYAMIFVGREYGEVKSTRILRADAVTLFLVCCCKFCNFCQIQYCFYAISRLFSFT